MAMKYYTMGKYSTGKGKENKIYYGNCLLCGKEFTAKNSRIGKIKKYCSHSCGTKVNAMKYYKQNKDSIIYKNKKRKILSKWVENNRAHFNDLCREVNKIRRHKNYLIFDEKGLCVECGKTRDNPRKFKRELFLKTCIKCTQRKHKRKVCGGAKSK